jgi:DNA modification methylase
MEVNKIYNENCLKGLGNIPDGTVHCCITSPPYWGLRDYGHNEQLGSEKHFKEFVINLSNVFDEVKRVLKPKGTCFINLGDTYGGSGSGTTKNADTAKYVDNSKQVYVLPNGTSKASQFRGTAMNKSLCMIPERFAIEMIDRGWCLRNQIIWHKPNQMPSSATDRFTVDFEKIFFFVKQPTDYYFQQQFEPYTNELDRSAGNMVKRLNGADEYGIKQRIRDYRPNEDGKNMRTVWSINTSPFPKAHFATYPEKLVERMLKSGCPEGGIVLDPFMGAGTTAVVARKMKMNYIGFELNPEYIQIANTRLYDELGMFL